MRGRERKLANSRPIPLTGPFFPVSWGRVGVAVTTAASAGRQSSAMAHSVVRQPSASPTKAPAGTPAISARVVPPRTTESARACRSAETIRVTVGLTEQTMFYEINVDKVDRPRGMDITVVTTASNNDEGRALLRELGFPFK